jgi:hypothetical protein
MACHVSRALQGENKIRAETVLAGEFDPQHCQELEQSGSAQPSDINRLEPDIAHQRGRGLVSRGGVTGGEAVTLFEEDYLIVSGQCHPALSQTLDLARYSGSAAA